MAALVIDVDDPLAPGVRDLIEVHLAFARATTPPEDVHALPLDALVDPAITFFTARDAATVVAIGALKELDPGHGELKSMHTLAAWRGRGIAQAMVAHLVDVARRRGYRRVSLETGATEAFAPARRLYLAAGFVPCDPFGDYRASPNSAYFTCSL